MMLKISVADRKSVAYGLAIVPQQQERTRQGWMVPRLGMQSLDLACFYRAIVGQADQYQFARFGLD